MFLIATSTFPQDMSRSSKNPSFRNELCAGGGSFGRLQSNPREGKGRSGLHQGTQLGFQVDKPSKHQKKSHEAQY